MIKAAMIGAGSIGFTRRLLMDILAVPELRDTEFRLMDISAENLEMAANLCRKMVTDNDLPAKVIGTTDRKEALRDADYVISTIRVGGLEAFAHDIEIPLKHGVDQCAATCRASVSAQEMTVEAAITGDRRLVKLALLHDPLTSAVCTPDQVWAMCDEMLDKLAPWLPQFS